MNKLDMQSKDIVKDNLEYIKERFPEAITEENGELRINPDSLIQSLSSVVIDDKKEKYELTWPGKKQAIVEGNTRTTKTLRPLKDKSVDFDKTENIYIEGDNLEALKILQESYLNRIKCIYIDPPYNTGNDFIYNDNFDKSTKEELVESGQIDELGNRLVTNNTSNGRFHSDWLSMMYPRLKLARNLLTNDGLIFISIDDDEIDNLRKLCDEIFGETNYVATLKWKKKKQPSFLSKVASIIEYILVYSKDYSKIEKLSVESLSDSDKPIVNAGNKSTTMLFKKGIRTKTDSSVKIINKGKYQNKSMSVEFLDDVIIENGRTVNEFRATTNFRTSQDLLNKYIDEDLVFITKNFGFRRDLSEEEKGSGKSITDLLLDWGQNQDGSDELKKLFDITDSFGVFDNPKPVLLIKNIIKSASVSDGIVLDFFSGSATTAQAVFSINAEDNASRKFILIQLPEQATNNERATELGYNTICEIGEERIRRAAKKIKEETNADIDYGFRVYKVDDSNMKDEFYITPDKISQEQIRLFEDNIKDDRTPEDLLTQVILNLGLKLDLPIEEKDMCGNKVYDVDDGELLACFDNNVSIDIIEEIAKINPRQVVFRDSSFATDQDKVNFEERLKRLSAGTKFNVL